MIESGQVFRKKTVLIALLLLAVLSLAPYIFICFYSLPFSDDFCSAWTASGPGSFTDKFLDEYLKWSGRYTSDALENFNPMITGKIGWYQLTLMLSLLALPFIFFLFFKLLSPGKTISALLCFIVSLFYLGYQPNVTEGIYWFMGIITWHLGNLTFLLQLTLLLKSFSSGKKTKVLLWCCSLCLLIVSIGFNEIGAFLIPVFYFCFILAGRNQELSLSAIDQKVIRIHFLAAMAAAAFVFFAPGNFIRENVFEDRYDLSHTLIFSSLQTIRFIGKWSLTLPFILFSLLIVALADKVQSKFLKQTDYRIIFAFLLFTVFCGSFFPYFATGILGQHRTINYVFFYFILLWILFLISVSEKFLLFQQLLWLRNGKMIPLLMLAGMIALAFSGNSLKIIRDFREDNFRKYHTAFMERQKSILQNPEGLIQPLDVIPEVFTLTDVKVDSTWWVDKCMKNFYTETNLVLK